MYLLFDEDPDAEALEEEKAAVEAIYENAKERQRLEREKGAQDDSHEESSESENEPKT